MVPSARARRALGRDGPLVSGKEGIAMAHPVKRTGALIALVAIAVVGLVPALVPAAPASADDINPGVFAIDSQPYGLAYGQWSARWWQWAFSLTSKTVEDCRDGQSGPVWFL